MCQHITLQPPGPTLRGPVPARSCELWRDYTRVCAEMGGCEGTSSIRVEEGGRDERREQKPENIDSKSDKRAAETPLKSVSSSVIVHHHYEEKRTVIGSQPLMDFLTVAFEIKQHWLHRSSPMTESSHHALGILVITSQPAAKPNQNQHWRH